MTSERDMRRTPTLRWAARPVIAAALLTGLTLRLAFGLGWWVDKPLTLDEQEYLILAQSLVEGRGLTYSSPSASPGGTRHFERPPGYPVFLAGVMTLSGGFAGVRHDAGVPTPVKVVQSIVGLVTVLLIGLIARRAAGERAGTIAVWIAAIYPPLVWSCAYVLSETLYTLLAFAVVLLLGDAFDDGRSNGWKVCAAGVVTGAALLTREAMLFFLVLGALWLVAHRQWRFVATFLAGALIVLLPWIMRNAIVHGGFVVGAPHGGVTFWTGNNELARGEGDMAANPALRGASLDIEARNPGLSARELERCTTGSRSTTSPVTRSPGPGSRCGNCSSSSRPLDRPTDCTRRYISGRRSSRTSACCRLLWRDASGSCGASGLR